MNISHSLMVLKIEPRVDYLIKSQTPFTPIVTHSLKVLPQQVSSQSSLTSTTQVPKGLHIVTIQSFDSIICYVTIS